LLTSGILKNRISSFSVINSGKLSGYAWAENVGWIKFNPLVAGDPNDYGVKIDTVGNFSGFAWGENIGWINFSINNYYVVARKVTFVDLVNFVDDWLETVNVPGNLDLTVNVDFTNFRIFADYWLCYCPVGWPLK
jgi:hypothetical protein